MSRPDRTHAMQATPSDFKAIETKPSEASAVETAFQDCVAQIQSRPFDLSELINVAERLKSLGSSVRSADLYKHWIAFNPSHPLLYAAFFNYGMALADVPDLAGAVNALRETARLNPPFYAAKINLGSVLERQGQGGAALESWTAILAQLPDLDGNAVNFKTMALKQLGRVLKLSDRDREAEEYLRQSLDINPNQGDVVQQWIDLRQRQCTWPLLVEFGQVKRRTLAGMISPLSIACYTDDPMLQLANAYRYCRSHIGIPTGADVTPSAVRMKARRPGPLRIGYVSSDLRQHAVGFSMTEVMELHDRTRCEVFAYYCGIATNDPTHARIKGAVDHWRDLTGQSHAEAAERIRADGIDILVDLNGHTKDARTEVFALRPAPVAANWFGFPSSMGSPYHHYIIADETIIPERLEKYYSETVLRLPCYQPNDRKRTVADIRPTRRQLGLPDDAFVFCSFNAMQKITERTFGRWTSILAGVPGSVLWMLTGTEATNAHLRALAVQRGIAADRLIFAEKMTNPQHLARYPAADLFLDAFPYGAHTTASDALWMGVPVLTLAGRSFASRVCASLLTAVGLDDLICTSGEDYVSRAVSLGRAPETARAIRERLIRNRPTALLFDTPLLVRRLEGLYQQMADAAAYDALPKPRLRDLDVVHEIGSDLDLEAMETLSDEAYEALYRRRTQDFLGA